LAGRRSAWKSSVVIERFNPTGLHQTPGYHHVTVTDSVRTAYLAGQCPLDEQGLLVGPADLVAQVDQVIVNIGVALASIAAAPTDVVRTVIYVVSASRQDLATVWTRLQDCDLSAAFTSASTLLGVAQLGYPGQLVEIDVTAATTP
jgi:enamine deaminase RidA (YjgF/YER057c/UK114 family)